MKRYLTAGMTVLALTVGALSMAYADNTKIILNIDEPTMTVNGEEVNIDENGTVPVISNGRTLVPIRAVVEAMGGNVGWNSETSTALLDCDNNHIELTIGSKTAVLNGESKELDTEPVIINSRTMLPLRFVSESFGYDVEWNNEDKSITISGSSDNAAEVSENPETPEQSAGNTLVIYYNYAENIEKGDLDVDAISSASLDGNVNGNVNDLLVMAKEIQAKTGGDIFSVRTNELYPSDYSEMVYVAQDDQNDNKQFTFIEKLPDLDKYDTIYIGTPVWWGKLPQPMKVLMEENDFSGKKIIPFGIHAGSRFGSIVSQYKEYQPDADVSDDGLTVHADTKNEEAVRQVDAWFEKQ